MRWSQAFIPTIKEAPADATSVSHLLLMRGGFIRRIGAGIYEYLPLGLRVLHKVQSIVRAEMDRAGALEVLMPALLPADYFRETGRWDVFGDNLLRLKDRKGGDYHLGPTHEEIITDMVRREIRSYRDLPRNLYQIQTKYRDEPRPRGGLLRCREFTMKDAYSFDVDEAGALASYEKMRVAYTRIFDRMGLAYRLVQADSGSMGGSTSAEFQVLVQSGEDFLAACDSCDYAANLEVAESRAPADQPAATATPPLSKVATPNVGTIAEVSAFLKAPPDRFLKSLLYLAGGEIVMAVVRGDHELNEIKLARALGVSEVALANEEQILKATGARTGFAGPVGFKGKVVVDRAAALVHAGITGANEGDFHIIDVEHTRDYQAEVRDIRSVAEGDGCPRCAKGSLKVYRGIEAGHIFVLGTHYSAKMKACYLDDKGAEHPIVMGCYGIGVSRLVATTIEQFNDTDGMLWPMSIAPYQVHVVGVGQDAAVVDACNKLVAELEQRGVEVLFDDRVERPGVKFKDADLIGIPLRVTIGAKGLASGGIELKPRTERDSKKAEIVPVDRAAEVIAERVRAMLTT
ncbi:MAG: proline--tRNA ligase [Deltaproteobacteria bacterium]|nr:proline--tRNA ligase [Deltaproteobacteria bacterium]